MNGSLFEQKDLEVLHTVLRNKVGIEVDDDELYEAAISCIKFTAGKILRQANLI